MELRKDEWGKTVPPQILNFCGNMLGFYPRDAMCKRGLTLCRRAVAVWLGVRVCVSR